MYNMNDIKIGDEVDVSEPMYKEDYWDYSFTGVVIDKKCDLDNREYLIVKDQEDNVFWVSIESVEFIPRINS